MDYERLLSHGKITSQKYYNVTTTGGQHEACVFYYESDDEPLYALVHVDDILVVGASRGYEKSRSRFGDHFLVTDVGDLNKESSKLDTPRGISHWGRR